MQFDLFFEEESIKEDYGLVARHVLACGRASQFLDCRVRKYIIDNGDKDKHYKAMSSVLSLLTELESVGIGIYMDLFKIAREKGLKIINPKYKYFNSNFLDGELVLPTDRDKCLKSAKDLFYKSLSTKKYLYDVFGRTDISWIKHREPIIVSKFNKFHSLVSEIKQIIEDDIQSR